MEGDAVNLRATAPLRGGHENTNKNDLSLHNLRIITANDEARRTGCPTKDGNGRRVKTRGRAP